MPVPTRPEIYFACSISGGRGDALIYAELVRVLRCWGRVLTEEFADPRFVEEGMPPRTVNQRDLDLLVRADVLIAEMTQPSLGVGYEVSKAESWHKPILCLYRPSAHLASPMITGAKGVACAPYRSTRQFPAILSIFFSMIDAS